jgi:GNAT superfamily N-acetyltransferase
MEHKHNEPPVREDLITIVPYSDELKEHIKVLNVEWLEKYFRVEPKDEIQLSHPQEEIMDKGGIIYFARWNDQVVGTATLLKIDDESFELAKMAVAAHAQGKGIGTRLMEHCFDTARMMGIKTLFLESNTKLVSAIHLYRKYGFLEVPMEAHNYERANIRMKKTL